MYHSAAEAYNSISGIINELGEILVFTHQDIIIDDDDIMKRIETEISQDANQILGVAGMNLDGVVLSNLKYKKSDRYIVGHQLECKTQVASVDECFFAISKELFSKLWFDEKVCFHWHLYAVDLCYEARRKYGTKSYVLPESIFHKFDGEHGLTTDKYFLRTMWRLTKKYKKDFIRILAPCYIVDTHPIPAVFKLIKSYVHNMIKSI